MTWTPAARTARECLASAPSFLAAGRVYDEREFLEALAAPARRILAFQGPSGG
jgi:hypothetical protein